MAARFADSEPPEMIEGAGEAISPFRQRPVPQIRSAFDDQAGRFSFGVGVDHQHGLVKLRPPASLRTRS